MKISVAHCANVLFALWSLSRVHVPTYGSAKQPPLCDDNDDRGLTPTLPSDGVRCLRRLTLLFNLLGGFYYGTNFSVRVVLSVLLMAFGALRSCAPATHTHTVPV